MNSGLNLPQEPWLEFTVSDGFCDWLAAHDISLSFTTYQAGKLFFVGRNSDDQLSVFERTFNRCMGLSGNDQTLWMSSLYQLWRFENVLPVGQLFDGYDRLFVPRSSCTTGDLDIHDIGVDASGQVVFANTRFGCLGTISERQSFRPLWMPPHLTELVAEDRCHLNGIAFDHGNPVYVTTASLSDVRDGWREHRRHGGAVLDVPGGRVVASGLSMPHSPRIYHEKLWLLNSGHGDVGYVDLNDGRFHPILFCPGYLRGLAFTGNYAVAGLSLPRSDKTFSGLHLDERLSQYGIDARCGLVVIDLTTGSVAHHLWLSGAVRELYDVVLLHGCRRPMALGFATTEIERLLTIENPEGLKPGQFAC